MKKLIMAMSVMATMVVSAASVNWNSAAITMPDGSAAAKGSVTGYLFVIDKTTYDALVADLGTGGGKELSDIVYSNYGDKTGTAYATKTSPKAGTANMTDDSKDYAAGSTAYAVLLYTATQDEKDYYMGNIGSALVEGAMDVNVDNMGRAVFGGASTTPTAWSTAAVPEPTSGLLMLLGMAGLALRRRRA